jgi:biotin operon repressor
LAIDEHLSGMLAFFKALSDENRLKIVGLLAHQPYTVEKLADALGLSISTTSHHLARLASAGLVTVRVEGHYYYYSLQTENLKEMTQQMMKDDEIARLSQNVEEDAFARKVMKAFVDRDGRITAFPAQEKKFMVLLQYVVNAFERDVKYTEKQVNEILARYNADTSSLRRGLIEYRLMQRESNGSAYWRIDAEK